MTVTHNLIDEAFLADSYDAYPRIEEAFQRELDVSLGPRGADLLYDLVGALALPPGADILDIGCGEGKQAVTLTERFHFNVLGVDPIVRHMEVCETLLAETESRLPSIRGSLSFRLGRAEAIPLPNASVDFIWCRDVLVHVENLTQALAEFRRVLRPSSRILIYQSTFATQSISPHDLDVLWAHDPITRLNADPSRTEAAVAAAGLHIDECLEVGLELGESAEERTGSKSRSLLHVTRLLRAPERYIAQFGQTAYDIMLADCLLHVYQMLGKLSQRVYLLTRT